MRSGESAMTFRGETSRNDIPGGQPGQSGEVARRLDAERRISHDVPVARPAGTIFRADNPASQVRSLADWGESAITVRRGMRPSRWPQWCQRGALNRARAADRGAGG